MIFLVRLATFTGFELICSHWLSAGSLAPSSGLWVILVRPQGALPSLFPSMIQLVDHSASWHLWELVPSPRALLTSHLSPSDPRVRVTLICYTLIHSSTLPKSWNSFSYITFMPMTSAPRRLLTTCCSKSVQRIWFRSISVFYKDSRKENQLPYRLDVKVMLTECVRLSDRNLRLDRGERGGRTPQPCSSKVQDAPWESCELQVRAGSSGTSLPTRPLAHSLQGCQRSDSPFCLL